AFLDRIPDNGSGIAVNIATSANFDGNRMSFATPMVRGNDGTVWLATWRLFASHDFAATWTTPGGTTDLTTGPSDQGISDVVSTIAVSESDPRTLYTGSAAGRIMVTRDGGVTYSDITPPVNLYVSGFAIDHTTPDVAYVAFRGYSSNRVMKTTDGGKTWT